MKPHALQSSLPTYISGDITLLLEKFHCILLKVLHGPQGFFTLYNPCHTLLELSAVHSLLFIPRLPIICIPFSVLTHLHMRCYSGCSDWCIDSYAKECHVDKECNFLQFLSCSSYSELLVLSLKPWLHLRNSARTANSTTSKLLCDRSRRWLHMQPGVPDICNMLPKVQFDEYSEALSHRFYCRICPSLDVQHSSFPIPATSEISVVLPVRVKMTHA